MWKQGKWLVVSGALLSLLFCSSFVFFYHRAQKQAQASGTTRAAVADRPLPEARLVGASGEALSHQALRKGRVVLIFMTPECEACQTEADFLGTLLNERRDTKFYGVISFGDKDTVLREAGEKGFPFEVLYDDGFRLAGRLGINRVPVKIFLEDGVIKKAWGGASADEEKKAAFVQYLDSL